MLLIHLGQKGGKTSVLPYFFVHRQRYAGTSLRIFAFHQPIR